MEGISLASSEALSRSDSVVPGPQMKATGLRRSMEKLRRSHLRNVGQGSIPTRYRTIIYQNDEKRGFLSGTERFASHSFRQNDNPGPGTYSTGKSQLHTATNTTSYSKKGTSNFSSESARFSSRKLRQCSRLPGPGSYDPIDGLHALTNKNFNQASSSRNFSHPIATQVREKHHSPAPNAYEIRSPEGKTLATASFRARSQRQTVDMPTAENPAPGQYKVTDGLSQTKHGHRDVFLSAVERKLPASLEKTPGPGTYNAHHPVELPQRQRPYPHALCLAAPPLRLPPPTPPPAPGQYETHMISSFSSHTAPATNAVFRSVTKRIAPPVAEQTAIGPATYRPVLPGRQYYLYNPEGKWVT